MSKKRFIYGFESLFGGPDEGLPQEETPVIELEGSYGGNEKEEVEVKPKKKRRRPKRVVANAVADTAQPDRRSSSKSFTSDLESLFMDAMTNAFEEEINTPENISEELSQAEVAEEEPIVENAAPAEVSVQKELALETEEAPQPKPVRKRRVIRSPRTRGGLDLLIRQTSEETFVEYESENKRVTFVFDKKKLERLKTIAKSKKLFLKDIIGDVVSTFIDQYEDSNGDLQ